MHGITEIQAMNENKEAAAIIKAQEGRDPDAQLKSAILERKLAAEVIEHKLKNAKPLPKNEGYSAVV